MLYDVQIVTVVCKLTFISKMATAHACNTDVVQTHLYKVVVCHPILQCTLFTKSNAILTLQSHHNYTMLMWHWLVVLNFFF